jgi:hypothetical protein
MTLLGLWVFREIKRGATKNRKGKEGWHPPEQESSRAAESSAAPTTYYQG